MTLRRDVLDIQERLPYEKTFIFYVENEFVTPKPPRSIHKKLKLI